MSPEVAGPSTTTGTNGNSEQSRDFDTNTPPMFSLVNHKKLGEEVYDESASTRTDFMF